jgi:hypothetical protein
MEFAIEQLRQIPGVERAISAARGDRELPSQIMALLPAALSTVRNSHPNVRPQKGLVAHEIKRLLEVKHGLRVSERRIAGTLPRNFCRN